MVKVYPRVIYHSDEDFQMHQAIQHRYPRDVATLTLVMLLGLGVTAGIGTGTTALIKGSQQLSLLELAINTDLQELEKSVSALQTSFTSLSKVVLQNKRGLDLLFLKEGGLCAALKEECCFYADHSGVVKESMAKLRERLQARQKELQNGQNWFESWFNQSPWLTTLLSAVAGPLIMLLLLVTVGPFVLSRLTQFIRSQVSQVKILMLHQQYDPIPLQDL